jgi:hypothetical protein
MQAYLELNCLKSDTDIIDFANIKVKSYIVFSLVSNHGRRMTTKPKTRSQTVEQDKISPSIDNEHSFKWLIILLAIIAFCLNALYFMNFNDAWGNQADFGAFGDFLGGVLNPVLGFATVGLLIWSLKLQMNELALTRQELAETKEETALSRLAMENQVSHLEKEAKLNELMRLMSDLRAQFQQQILAKIAIDVNLFDILINMSGPGEGKTTTINNIDMNSILYEETSWSSHKSEYLRIHLMNNLREKEYKQWQELENQLINFSNIVIKYHALSSSPVLANIYINEARKMLQPFQDIFFTEVIATQLGLLNSILLSNKKIPIHDKHE